MEGPAWLRALPDELAARVVEANALASAPGVREVDGEDAVRLACNLIIAGVDAPEVVDLACQPCDVDGLTASVLIRAAMDALGLAAADEYRMEWVETRKIALRVVSGELEPDVGMAELWPRWTGSEDSEDLALALPLAEAWQGAPAGQWAGLGARSDPAGRADLEARSVAFARDVVELADRRLAEHDGR